MISRCARAWRRQLAAAEVDEEQPHRLVLVGQDLGMHQRHVEELPLRQRHPLVAGRAGSRSLATASARASLAKARASPRNMLRGNWSSRMTSARQDVRRRSASRRGRRRAPVSQSAPPAVADRRRRALSSARYQPSGPSRRARSRELLARVAVHRDSSRGCGQSRRRGAKREASLTPLRRRAPIATSCATSSATGEACGSTGA